MVEQPGQVEATPTALSVHGAGLLLVQAREKAGMSQEEAATQLRLSIRQVKALEEGDMAALPSPAFVRGFIRNYAKVLHIDAAPLLEAYRVHAPGAAQGQISLHSENILLAGRSRKQWLPYAAASIILGVALGGWLAYMDYTAVPADKASSVAATPPAAPIPVPAEEGPAAPATAEPLPILLPAEPAEAAPVETAAVVEPSVVVPAAAGSVLKLAFFQAGWVSVHDQNGKEIFNKTAPAGSEETVSGTPPFSLVLGNAGGVRVTYKDKPVDLAPHTRANVARLTLE